MLLEMIYSPFIQIEQIFTIAYFFCFLLIHELLNTWNVIINVVR